MNHKSTYADLEIRILAKQKLGYPIEMTFNGRQEFPRGYLRPDFLPWVSGSSPGEDGERLFNWLFADNKLRLAWAEVRGQQPQRRIRLRIDASAPELHAIPWERLRDAETTPPQDLAAATATPFSRYLAGKWLPGKPIPGYPLNLLVVIANPQNLADYNLAPIDVEAEWASLQSATGDLGVVLTRLPQPCTLSTLEAALKEGYHILHFIGHGHYSQRQNQGQLYLADSENKVSLVNEAEFAAMLARQGISSEASEDNQLRLAFLAGCQTATRSPADAFRGFAPALVKAGLPAVLAMQDLVPINTAQAFSHTFYRQLLQHGQVDLASNEARSALISRNLPGSNIPVLFSRLPDNQLLIPPEGEARPTIETKPFEPETLYIPAGSFLMGSQEGEGVKNHETPQHKVDLPAYRIGKYPITNQEYLAFVEETKHPVSSEAGWVLATVGKRPREDKLNHPVVGISWDDGQAYCRWLGQKTGRVYRLPTEAEWEKAARGFQDNRIYPWGDDWNPQACNYQGEATTPIDQFPPQSPYQCCDMVGNVWEWTSTIWGHNYTRPDYAYPYQPDQREVLEPNQPHREYRVWRGGSFLDAQDRLTCSARAREAADERSSEGGFRVVLELR